MGITIVLNGKKEDAKAEMSVSELLAAKNIKPEVVTVEINDSILEKQKYSGTILQESDRIEFVYYMGGGVFESAGKFSG
ncbi:MAG: sulfur carrier protein ThiS [Candidatus Omnitrophota bacterium]|nr:sulfur carrier protein ThiS [Candidatus Omnitrophota bacterium]